MNVLFFFATVLTASCPDLNAAKSYWLLDRSKDSARILECRRAESPGDFESRRLLSDLYWWQNEASKSEEVAVESLNANPPLSLKSHFYRRQARFRFSTDYLFTDGIQGRIGHEIEARGSWRYWNKNNLEIGYRRLGRAYRDLPLSYDSVWLFKHRLQPLPSMALEAELEYSRDPSFSSEWAILATPVYYWREFEFGLGIQSKKYPSEWTILLRPQTSYVLTDLWTFALRGDLSLKPKVLASVEASTEWKFLSDWSVRLAGGGGKTDEGNSIVDTFGQGSVRLTWDAFYWLRLRALSSIYRGNVREEWRVGGGFDCFF